MDPQSTSLTSTVPNSPLPPRLDQSNFRRVSRTEETNPYSFPGLRADILHMRVKEGSKIRNLLRFAAARMQGEGKDSAGSDMRQVVFTGSGRGVIKTITCVEILKRKLGGLHQVTKLHNRTACEVWESLQHGVPGVTLHRTLPVISILLSKDPLDPQEPGYQGPQAPGGEERGRGGAPRSPPAPHTSPDAKRVCVENTGFPSTSTGPNAAKQGPAVGGHAVELFRGVCPQYF